MLRYYHTFLHIVTRPFTFKLIYTNLAWCLVPVAMEYGYGNINTFQEAFLRWTLTNIIMEMKIVSVQSNLDYPDSVGLG